MYKIELYAEDQKTLLHTISYEDDLGEGPAELIFDGDYFDFFASCVEGRDVIDGFYKDAQ